MTEINQIEVWMHGRQVGRLALTPQRPQTCAFEYTAEWLQDGFSISPFELPLTPGLKIAPFKPFDGHFGVFADSLPDGWGQLILHRHLAQQGINSQSINPLQQLCLVGGNGRGALEYRPDKSIRSTQEYLDLERIAAESYAILEDDNYTGKYLAELVQRGGSPGGVRPKIFLKQDGAEWLVKFRAKGDKKSVGKEEYHYSQLARQCGIDMPETRLFENQWFGTKRFDRIGDKKLHVVSAAGLLQADYQIPSIDYYHLFNISARLSHSIEQLWKIYRLMCFNVIIGNRDDHARNFSFVYDNGWSFSPAYDLLPCGSSGDYHTSSVNDNPLPGREDVLRLAERVGLDAKQAVLIYDEILSICSR
ncbi:MAG: type II toxin-antitoxin system HipA family toxin [Paludibacteraceae bacterium]|nr:type II toxin-antitoxin system HipA family toxin [Paludibacteraceae bacterium]